MSKCGKLWKWLTTTRGGDFVFSVVLIPLGVFAVVTEDKWWYIIFGWFVLLVGTVTLIMASFKLGYGQEESDPR